MISAYGQTDIGQRRTLNEDCILVGSDLFVLCDGMGGHKSGEVASALAADVVSGFIRRSAEDTELTWPYGFDPQISYAANRLHTAIKLANRAVFRKAASGEDYTGMGTTIAAVLAQPGGARITYASVGDSRIYLVRDGRMTQLTRDDSWAAVWQGEGNDSDATGPLKNVLTKAVGAREDVDFEVRDLEIESGDIVLLCSDGLTNMVPDSTILNLVTANGDDLEAACRALIDCANAQGGRDNISVILIRRSR